MAKPCRVVVSPQLAEILNLEPNQDLSYREWVQILHDGGLDKLTERAIVAIEAAKKESKEKVLPKEDLEQRSINEPRNAKDVAIIFRKLFNFSPAEAVWAARKFDAKATYMSKVRGISKEDYYKQYWFGGELSEKGKELNQIVGENAELAQDIRDNLQVARNMESAGKDAKTIRLATSWEKGADGKWRYEINPSELYFSLEDLTNAMPKGSATTELGKLIKNDALFKAYPQLKNLKIEIHNEPKSGLIAGYNPASKEIFINLAQIEKLSKDKTKGESERSMLGLRELLGHEIQHIIQFEEGFAIGGGKNQGEKAFRSEFSEYAKQKGIKETNIEFENYLKNILGDKWREYAYNGYLRLAGEVEARNVQTRMNMTPEERKAKMLSETEDVAREEQIILFGEQEGGLSQMSLPDGRKVTVKPVDAEVANGFYSNTENALAQVKQEKMSGNQWATQLLSRGANKEEMGWTGLEGFLKENAAKSISKADIQQFLKDNRISVVEVVKGSGGKKLKARRLYRGENTFEITDESGNRLTTIDAKDEADALEQTKDWNMDNSTKFSQYQLEGEKENYKEVLVTMPSKELPKGYEVQKVILDNGDVVYRANGDGLSTPHKSYQEAESELKERAKEFYGTGKLGGAKFNSTHFDEPDILVHLRMNTRTDANGNKVLFLEEVQSDWGQTGKKEGFRNEKESEVAGKKALELAKKINDKYPNDVKVEINQDGSNAEVFKKIDGEWKRNVPRFKYSDEQRNEIDALKENSATVSISRGGGKDTAIPTAPFVTDTNAWTKLGLKVALKEAVKQGADKIAWSTGTQQFDRWGSEEISWRKNTARTPQEEARMKELGEKIVNYKDTNEERVEHEKLARKEGGFSVLINEQTTGATAFNGQESGNKDDVTIQTKDDLRKAIKRNLSRERNDAEIDKLTDRIWNRMQTEDSGTSLPRKEGMEAFYGVPSENKLGIVGNVAKSLFKQEPKAIDIKSAYKGQYSLGEANYEGGFGVYDGRGDLIEEFDTEKEANDYIKSKDTTTQHSIDITPELKAQVEVGQPLFQSRKGSWSKEAAKMKRFISMYEKADSTTEAHEVLGHDYLDEIIELSATNEEFANDLDTIVEEYIKETGSKVSKEKLLEDLKSFDVEKKQNENGKKVHEWFAETAERYFATEKGVKTDTPISKKMAAIFEKFRKHLADLYRKMNKELVEPSPAMKQIFRKVFGSENFTQAEEIRKEAFDRIESLRISELEKNSSGAGKKSILDKYKPKEGLGQITDEFEQDMYDLAKILIDEGSAQRYNVTDKIQELMPHLKDDIEKLRKSLQQVGTKGTLRQGVENLLANPNILPEVKERIQKLGEYTPEKMATVGLNAEQILSYYSAEKGNDIDGMAQVAKMLDEKSFPFTTEKVALRQLLIANYNQLAKMAKTQEKKEEYLNLAVEQAEKYSLEGTGLGRMVNMYRALGSLTSEGLIIWAQKQQRKYIKPSYDKLRGQVSELKNQLKKATEDIDFFLTEVLQKEQSIENLQEELSEINRQLEEAKKQKGKPVKDKASTLYKNVKSREAQIKSDELEDLLKDFKSTKLFQDVSDLSTGQKIAYYLMERSPMNIVQFAKSFSKLTGQKYEPSELKEVYRQVRDLLVARDIGFAEGLSANQELEKDLQDISDANRAKTEELERKKAEKEAKIAEKKAEKAKEKAEEYQKELQTLEKTKEKLAESIVLDAKNAEGLIEPKQAEYLNELLKAIKGKVKETYPQRVAKPTDPYDALKFALNSLVDMDGAKLFEDAKAIVDEKIDSDENLTDAQKDSLKSFVEDYQNFIFDQVLSKGKAGKVVQQALKDLGYVTPKGNIDWDEVLYRYRQNKGAVKNDILRYIDFTQMAGIERGLAVRVLRSLMESYDVQLNKANERYYQKNTPSHINLTASKAADKLSDFVLSDLKRAMNGSIPKQKTYIEELLTALKSKAREVALKGEKAQTAKAPVDTLGAIKMALDAIQNGKADASIWNDAVEQVKAKIKDDNTLSQKDKDDLNLYLNDYTSFVYDNMLNDSVIFKAIKESLINNGYGSGNNVNFRALITGDSSAQIQERQRLLEKIKSDLSQYDPIQVEKILDIVADRYQRLINEKRKDIANQYVNNLLKGKPERVKKAVRGKIGKLLVENRMGLLEDSNNSILNVLAESKGLVSMTSKDWVKLKEYADIIESLPADSNLQNEAIEEMTAFVRTKMPGRWLVIAQAIRYANLLGRVTSNLKNAIGGFEQAALISSGRLLRGDKEFVKAGMRGFRQGDFKDILLGGGINQASRVSVEADNNGMPHFRILEYLNPTTLVGKTIESAKYSGRMLDAMDSVWQKFFTSAYDIKYMRKLLEFENPNATKAEIDAKINDILSKERFADYYEQAVKDVIKTGKKVTEAKVKRRTYEIMRQSLIRPMAMELADLESMEKTYKTKFEQNMGLGTASGMVAEYIANASRRVVEYFVKGAFEMRGYSEQAAEEQAKLYGGIIPKFILPFSQGISGFIEKGLERELVYGLAKAMVVGAKAKAKEATTIEEKMLQARAFEKAKDIATTAVFTNLIMYGVGYALYALSKQWEEDEEKEGRYHPKTGVYGASEGLINLTGTSTVKEKTEPVNVIVLFGREYPLSYFGGMGVALSVDANIRKGFESDIAQKKTKDSSVATNFINSTNYIFDSFLQQSWLLQTNENKSIKKEIDNGNIEKALNIMENSAINYMGSYMVWSGFINQSLQGARALSGGDTYQEAKTKSEKIQKQFGLAGITYSNTKKNYLGEDIKYADVNREGIVGLVNMFKVKDITPVDNWLRNIGFKDSFKGQYAKALQDLDGYSPTVDEYDKYSDRIKMLFGDFAKKAYEKRSNIKNYDNDINPATKKPYTKEEWEKKVMSSALSAFSKYSLIQLKNSRGEYSDFSEYSDEKIDALYEIQKFYQLYSIEK